MPEDLNPPTEQTDPFDISRVLLRSDYGWVLDPRPGERRSRFCFSIGQAF